jgi:CheY-like chemotaxis protein
MPGLLLIEDDPDQRLLRSLILERAGLIVRPVSSPAGAVAEMERDPAACILMDLRMPAAEDGLRLIRVLSERWPKARIVVLSGYCEDLSGAPEAASVAATLRKPVRSERLLSTLRRVAPMLALFLLLAGRSRAQAESPMPLSFPTAGYQHGLWGGRPRPRPTPWSAPAAGGLLPLQSAGGSWGTRADRGGGPTRLWQNPTARKTNWHGAERQFPFHVIGQGETVARLTLSAPGADWAVPGREGALAEISLDGRVVCHAMVPSSGKWIYSTMLGAVPPGAHTLEVARHAAWSAAGASLDVLEAEFDTVPPTDERYLALAHAPVLHARADTVGKFTDVPLLVYCTRSRSFGLTVLEYTVVFSNEDGGTSTRDLMARWGRTVDIEYIYRLWLDKSGRAVKTLIQTKEHADIPYDGRYDGLHPVLEPVTTNNMVAPAGPDAASLRYRLAPVEVDLSGASRELVLDQNPALYEVTAREMAREDKVRPPLTFDGEKIADPRNYLVVELKVDSRYAALQALVLRRGEHLWRGSAVGLAKNFIERSGWARVAVELPPGTRNQDISGLAFQCISRRDLEKEKIPKDGSCRVETIGKVFFLAPDYRPGPLLPAPVPPQGGWRLAAGDLVTLDIR